MLKKMNKIISILLLMLTVFSITQPILAVSGTGNFVGGQFASNIYTTDSTSKPYGVLIRRLINYNTGEKFTVFCAENGIGFNTGTIYNGEYYTPSYAPMKRACKVAYLGWYSKYGDYVVDGGMSLEAKKDYVFTQQMIWEILEQSNDTFIDSDIQEEYENFKANIYQQIDNLDRKPSFDEQNIIIEIGKTKIIDDTNGVLENYNSIDVTTDGIRIVHNQGENFMTLTANDDCVLNDYRISNNMFKSWGMIKDNTQDNDTTIYFAFKEGVQNQLYSLHYNDPISLALNLEIERYGRLELTKLNDDGEMINGAVFNITGANDYNKTVVVENGKIVIENLKEGIYYVKEVSAPDGYLLNTKTYEIEVKPNETATQTIINEEPTGSFELTKTNKDGTLKLEGVTYRIWREDIGYDVTLKTDKNGKIKIDGLKLGTYKYQEINSIYEYLIDNTIYSFKLEYKDQNTSVVYASAERTNDVPTGSFLLVKKDEDGLTTLEGTKYHIWSNNGYDKTFITDKNGQIKVDGLKLGKYNYQEIQATYGYLLDNTIYSFELKYKDQNTSVVYANAERINRKPTGTFTLIKKNADKSLNLEGVVYRIWSDNGYDKTFTTDKNGQIKVENLKLGTYNYQEISTIKGYVIDNKKYTFKLEYANQNTAVVYSSVECINEETTGNFELTKTNKDGTSKLEGVTYRIWNEETGYDITLKTDKEGKIRINGLKLGKYNYQEIQATYGYLIDNTIYSFELKYKDQNTSVVYATSERTNEVPTGTFTLVKKNEDKSSNIEGVKYRIWSDNGYDKTFITDKNGQIKVEKLKLGTYNYQEIKTIEGYLLDNKIYSFKLEYKDQNTSIVYANAERINRKPTGTIEINKTIAKREGIDTSLVNISDLSVIKFKLYAKNNIINKANGSIIYKKGQEINTYNLSKDGKLVINNLPMGIYEIVETKTLDELVLNTTKYEIKFKQKDFVTKVYNETLNIVNDTTCAEFSKQDITGEKELIGAKLSVIDENNKVIDTWTSTDKTHKIEGLLVNKTYTLREEIAPDGYVVATDITFTVKDTKEIQKVTMIDKIIEITKTDITTGKELEGAELKVVDEDEKVIDTWVSTNEPHKVKGLKENKTYKLIEVIAPYGYELTEEIEFTVTEDKETQKIEMKDMPILENEFENQEIETPKTGDERNTLLWITLLGISITLLTILVVCEILKKRKNK